MVKRAKTATVASPAARSLSIIASLRFQRSTSAPAIGVIAIRGKRPRKTTKTRTVACLVASQAQIDKPNCDIPLPSTEASWPNQTTVKPAIPERRDQDTSTSLLEASWRIAVRATTTSDP